jgi:predicted DCC family thiol-disulfide oxidoreductase YuxK
LSRAEAPSAPKAVIVWFDSGCPLCAREIALFRWLDRGRCIEFVDVTDAAAFCPLDKATMLARFHASENGQIHSGAAAFAAMWRAIPLLRPLGIIARVPFVEKLLERAYIAFLRIRPRLQKWFK